MKNIFHYFCALAIGCTLMPNDISAQNVLPKKSYPVILAPQEMKVGFQENILSCNIEANIPFEVEKVGKDADWLTLHKQQDGKVYLHIDRNADMHTRSANITFFNAEKGIMEVMKMIQAGDLTIYPEDFENLLDSFVDEFQKADTQKVDGDIDGFMKKFNHGNGQFTDLDYKSTHRTLWAPQQVLDRINYMAIAYTKEGSKYHKNSAMYTDIVRALEYWHQAHPRSNNWYKNQIAVPQSMGATLMMMRRGEQKVPAALENKILTRIEAEGGAPEEQAGANRVDVAIHWIYQALLLKDEAKLKYGVKMVYDPVRYTTGEGFQVDGSYFQHGSQLYISHYGVVAVDGILKMARHIEKTKFAALGEERTALLSKYLRGSYYRASRGNCIHYSLLGRTLTREQAQTLEMSYAHNMKHIDKPEHAQEWDDIIARGTGTKPADYHIQSSNTHLFRGDYVVHVRPEYSFDVRMASNRVIRLESSTGNEENFFGQYLSDGSNNIVRTGDEYKRLLAFWNWNRIPGTTAPQFSPKPATNYMRKGSGTFCGAVSDSLYGAAAYVYYDTYDNINTGGTKSWFFFDKEVVCLGRVNSTAKQKVMTTINQCHNTDIQPIYHIDGQTKTLQLGDSMIVKNPEWVLHNHIGYVLPEGGNMWLASQKIKEDWYHINHYNRKDSVEGKVFTIAFDHGLQPKDDAYAYIVVPTVSTEKDLTEYCSHKSIEILSNNTNIQSVYNNELKIWQAIFYKAGELTHQGTTIKVGSPCAVMLKKNKADKYILHISDPNQSQRPVDVTITLPGKAEQKVKANFSGTGIYAGLTKAYILK